MNDDAELDLRAKVALEILKAMIAYGWSVNELTTVRKSFTLADEFLIMSDE